MPKYPKGEERPADVIGNIVHIMRIATGEIDDATPPDDGKVQSAVSMGRKGGAARAASLTAERRDCKNGGAKSGDTLIFRKFI